jgi:hypothetical protein
MKRILLVLVVASIFGCNSDESNDQTDMLDLNLVSGINLRETADQEPLKLGNPNIFVNNQFSVFPNPASDVVNVSSQNIISDIYFLSATAEKIHQYFDFNVGINSNTYQESTISSLSSLKLNNQDEAILNVDVSNLETGYYRVFIKTNGLLFWDNFYKLDNQTDSNIQIDNIIDFWN